MLQTGEVKAPALLPEGSNYAFLVTLEDGSGASCEAVYKPRAGERPLWDFPSGTLYKREYATYLVSKALGWPSVPPTVIRDGPHGVGSFQLFVDTLPEANYFTLLDDHVDEFRRIALFDCLVNNADRKAGHCLLGRDGRIWNIDHGLTFHPTFKLRTVIWDFRGQPIPEHMLADLPPLLQRLSSEDDLTTELARYLAGDELEALEHRARLLMDNPVFPDLDPYRNIPWPWF